MVRHRALIFIFLTFVCTCSALALAVPPPAPADKGSPKFSDEELNWLSAHPKIRIAFDAYYPPYSFIGDNNEFQGIAVDISREISDILGVELIIHPSGKWKEIYTAAQVREVDVIATLVKRQEREAWFEFTRPYLSLSQYFITRDTAPYTTPENLENEPVALIEGYSTSRLFSEEYPSINTFSVPDIAQALDSVAEGRAAATVADLAMANHYILTAGLQNLRFASIYTETRSKQRFGVRKDWPTLAVLMDKALASIEYSKLLGIYARWRVPEAARRETGFISLSSSLSDAEKDWLDQHDTIRLASDYAWPPFETINEKGIYEGIAADYIKLIEQRLNIKFNISPRLPWSDIVKKVKNKELDVFTAVAATPERNTFTEFTAPFISNPIVIITQDSVDFIAGISSLNGTKLAVEKDYATRDLILEDYPQQLFEEYSNTEQALSAVSKGMNFAYVGNLASASYTMRDLGLTNLKISGQLSFTHNLALGVRSDWPELASILDKTLDSISLEERNTIHRKWIDLQIQETLSFRTVFQFVLVIFIAILAVLIWNLSLNRKIKLRTKELIHQANHDTLTNLPNRFLCLELLSDLTIRTNSLTKTHVLMLDIDDFKYVNDTLGHLAGDKLLQEISERLSSVIGTNTLGRLGGDEFIAIIKDEGTSLNQAITDIIHCFKEPFKVNHRDLSLSTSIGISTYPVNATTVSDLLRFADIALHNSKRTGRNSFSHFDDSMRASATRRLLLEEHISTALEKQQFSVYFQPKVGLKENKLVGFEALLRWHSPELGFVSPVEFIPILENNGLIIPVGEFVFKEALEQISLFSEKIETNLSISVNVSPRQFRDPKLVENFTEILQQIKTSWVGVELEITEGVLMHANETTENAIFSLKKLGVKFAMDDFGTGYSSMSYLRNFPFDTLKIDREFIRDITEDSADLNLTVTAIKMAQGLKLESVAEGIEHLQQVELLKKIHCDIGQGFYFGKPMPAKKLSVWYTGFIADT